MEHANDTKRTNATAATALTTNGPVQHHNRHGQAAQRRQRSLPHVVQQQQPPTLSAAQHRKVLLLRQGERLAVQHNNRRLRHHSVPSTNSNSTEFVTALQPPMLTSTVARKDANNGTNGNGQPALYLQPLITTDESFAPTTIGVNDDELPEVNNGCLGGQQQECLNDQLPPPLLGSRSDIEEGFGSSFGSEEVDEQYEESMEEEEMEESDYEMEDDSANEEEKDPKAAALARLPSSVLPEYFFDILTSLLEREIISRPLSDYLSSVQNDLNTAMRAILVDWLVEVQDEFKLKSETLFLAVQLVDRFLSRVTVPRSKLQLVGVTAMQLASKHEEIEPPRVSDYVWITDNTYTKDELLRMELVLLRALSFELTVPTTHDFVVMFSVLLNIDRHVLVSVDYVVTTSLLDYTTLSFLPSVVAASAIILSLYAYQLPHWTPLVQSVFGNFDVNTLNFCMQYLHQLQTNATGASLQAIKHKYSHEKHTNVATLGPIAKAAPVLPQHAA